MLFYAVIEAQTNPASDSSLTETLLKQVHVLEELPEVRRRYIIMYLFLIVINQNPDLSWDSCACSLVWQLGLLVTDDNIVLKEL